MNESNKWVLCQKCGNTNLVCNIYLCCRCRLKVCNKCLEVVTDIFTSDKCKECAVVLRHDLKKTSNKIGYRESRE